jgi:regulator of chromosome condensation (RCC1) repeat-containing protein/Regulator of Chromosome Condensation (RCC1) repeat protein
MRRRRLSLLLICFSACGADLRCDPTFSCSDGWGDPPRSVYMRDASFGGECGERLCHPNTLAAGAQHTCASIAHDLGFNEGSTVCWGRNDARQLGAGDANTFEPVRTFFGPTLQIAAGVLHSCAIDATWVGCWGTNFAALIGGGNADAQTALVIPVAAAGPLLGVSAGAAHTCALAADGSLRCFGDNAFGQTAFTNDPYLSDLGHPVVAPPPAIALADAGGTMTCFSYRGSAEVSCFGREQIDDPFGVVPISIAGEAEALSAGAQHVCVIVDGAVSCWGDNTHGQLGGGVLGGRQYDSRVPIALPGRATLVSAGGWIPIEAASRTEILYGDAIGGHTCALVVSDVYCWGANALGQLGDGSTTDRALPVRVQLDVPARSISVGGEHTCAIAADSIYCWGDNSRGQLGVDPAVLAFSAEPVLVAF